MKCYSPTQVKLTALYKLDKKRRLNSLCCTNNLTKNTFIYDKLYHSRPVYRLTYTQPTVIGMHGLPRHVKSLSKGTLSSNNWVIVACLLPYPTLLYSTRSLATGLFSIAAPMYMSSAHVSSSSSSSSSRGSFSGSSSVSLGTELFKLWLKLGSCSNFGWSWAGRSCSNFGWG